MTGGLEVEVEEGVGLRVWVFGIALWELIAVEVSGVSGCELCTREVSRVAGWELVTGVVF